MSQVIILSTDITVIYLFVYLFIYLCNHIMNDGKEAFILKDLELIIKDKLFKYQKMHKAALQLEEDLYSSNFSIEKRNHFHFVILWYNGNKKRKFN